MSSSVVNFVVIDNPFEPVESAKRGCVEYEKGKPLAEYLGELEGSWMTTLNGVEVQKEQWYLTYPKANDLIIVSAIPHGGSDGAKAALRLVAVVALSFVAGPAGMIAANFGQVAAAGAMIGGTLLINAVLAPPTPDVNDDRDISDSPTYGQDTARNTSESGIPIPLVYGEYRIAGNIISSYAENVNDEQFLYVLYNAGEGEIAGIEDVYINDQPIANFNDVEIETRLGTEDQSAIGWFESVRRQNNVNSRIVSDNWRTYTFRDLADKASLEIVFPQGLYSIHPKKGYKYNASVIFDIEYRVYFPNQDSESGWQLLPWVTDDGGLTRGEYKVTAKQTSAVRRTIKTAELGENTTYEIRIRRTSETDSDYITDDVDLATVTEISVERVRYKYTALLALRILMSEQLNSTPTVSYINKGIICDVWNSTTREWEKQATNNPSWICYDILSKDRYGAGIQPDLLDLEKFIEWADWCADQRLEFNGVLDTASNAFDATESITRLGHAKLFTIGTRVSVTIEKPDYPVMMFSQANMMKDTFSINWMPISDRANEVEVTYYDRNYNYEARTVKVSDETSLINGDLQRPSSFTLVGCTDEASAFYEGLLALNYNKYVTQTYSFEASIDSIACTLGSVVYIQHDMPQWGYSGRLNDGNTLSSVAIDIDPDDMESTPQVIMIHFPTIVQGSGIVTSVIGNIIDADFLLPDKRAERVVISGRDYKILGIEFSSGRTRFRLEESAVAYLNERVEVYRTDVYEERVIDSIDGNIINLAEDLPSVPARYTQYLIGRVDTIKKRARIASIDYSDDHTRSISAIEYNESVYDRDIPFEPSPVQPDLGLITDSELSDIDEELIQIGKSIRPRLEIKYRNSSSRYQTTQVYISVDGAQYRLINTHRRQIIYESEDGAVLDIKLVPVDTAGVVKSIESVSPVRYIVQGKTAPPADVENLTFTKEVGGLQLSWDEVAELDLEGYEIRLGSSWDDAQVIAPAINSTVFFFPVSTPNVYEFLVRAIDTSGNLSSVPAYLRAEIIRPERVYNFNAVQHIDKVVMQWDRPVDRNITTFWIREGASWADSYIHGSVTGTSFELPAGKGAVREGTLDDDSRTFWIKAVDIIGIDSEDAVFSSTAIAEPPSRNVVFTEYHGRVAGGPGSSAPGIYLNTSGTYPIRLDDGASYGEYTAEITLPYQASARNTVGLEVGVLVTNTETWDSSIFGWDSQKARSGWAAVGNPENTDFSRFISTKTTTNEFYPNTSYLFSLNRQLTCDVTGISPDSASSVTYEPARYNYGAKVDETTNVRWSVTGTNEWTATSWVVIPKNITSAVSGVAGSVRVDGEPPIYLLLSTATNQIIMRQTGYQDLTIDEIYPSPGDIYYVGVSQLEGERTLRVRNLAWDTTRKSVIDVGRTMTPDGFGLGFN